MLDSALPSVHLNKLSFPEHNSKLSRNSVKLLGGDKDHFHQSISVQCVTKIIWHVAKKAKNSVKSSGAASVKWRQF